MCDTNVPVTSLLFGDDLSKTLKERREANRLGRDPYQSKTGKERDTGPTMPKKKRETGQAKLQNETEKDVKETVQTVNKVNRFTSLHVKEIRSSQMDCNDKYQKFVSKACAQA